MKQFLIIGNNIAIAYKEVFPLIKDNKIWLGMMSNKTMEFQLDDKYEHWDRVEDGKKYGKVPSVSWYTNLTNNKRNTPLDLYKTYSNEDYSKYDNYDAINVNKTAEIPKDYDGVMGVPITFLDKYCPDQFEIVGCFNNYKECNYENGLLCGEKTEYFNKNDKIKIWRGPTINKKTTYTRILIRHRKYN